MQRVLIVGPCGAGKSTLATRLGALLGLPVHHMDQINWRSGWIESSKTEIIEHLRHIIVSKRWIIDGTYGGTLAERLAHADTVLYLDYPIRLCLVRLTRRIWRFRGRSRPDMPDGCPERFDVAFFFYVARWNSGPRVRLENRLRGHEDKLIRFRNPAALDHWLAALPQSGA